MFKWLFGRKKAEPPRLMPPPVAAPYRPLPSPQVVAPYRAKPVMRETEAEPSRAVSSSFDYTTPIIVADSFFDSSSSSSSSDFSGGGGGFGGGGSSGDY